MQDSRRFLWESTTRARILLTRIISQTGELQKWRQMWLPEFAGWQKRMAGPIRQRNETELQMTLRSALSVFAGLFVGILFSYLAYRLSLPMKPFVYVAF